MAAVVVLLFGGGGSGGDGDGPATPAADASPDNGGSDGDGTVSGRESPSVARTPTPSATGAAPTLTPDFPDLVVADTFSRENRLVVVLRNQGDADLFGPIDVTINDGQRHRVDVGKELRPGDAIEAKLEGEFVQRRAEVEVRAFAAPDVEEISTANNTRTLVVSPDAPNDLEVLPPSLDAADGHLIVTIRNNSPIPLVGTVTIAVRRISPSELLRLLDAPLEVAAGGNERYDFLLLIDFDPDSIRVILSTDAINDAVPTNDTYPR